MHVYLQARDGGLARGDDYDIVLGIKKSPLPPPPAPPPPPAEPSSSGAHLFSGNSTALTTTMPKYTAREKRRVYRVLAPALLSRTVRLEYEIFLPVMICNAADEGGNEHGCMEGWAG